MNPMWSWCLCKVHTHRTIGCRSCAFVISSYIAAGTVQVTKIYPSHVFRAILPCFMRETWAGCMYQSTIKSVVCMPLWGQCGWMFTFQAESDWNCMIRTHTRHTFNRQGCSWLPTYSYSQCNFFVYVALYSV